MGKIASSVLLKLVIKTTFCTCASVKIPNKYVHWNERAQTPNTKQIRPLKGRGTEVFCTSDFLEGILCLSITKLTSVAPVSILTYTFRSCLVIRKTQAVVLAWAKHSVTFTATRIWNNKAFVLQNNLLHFRYMVKQDNKNIRMICLYWSYLRLNYRRQQRSMCGLHIGNCRKRFKAWVQFFITQILIKQRKAWK